MKKLYEFTIPDLPPSLDSIYKVGKGRKGQTHIYKDENVAVFEKICMYMLPKIEAPLECLLSLSLTYTFKDHKQWLVSDVDNRLKVMLDTLQKLGIVKNDRQIKKLLNVELVHGLKDSTSGFLCELL